MKKCVEEYWFSRLGYEICMFMFVGLGAFLSHILQKSVFFLFKGPDKL